MGPFLCPSPSPGSGLGSELWPFIEVNHQIGPKIGTFVILFGNPFSNGHSSIDIDIPLASLGRSSYSENLFFHIANTIYSLLLPHP